MDEADSNLVNSPERERKSQGSSFFHLCPSPACSNKKRRQTGYVRMAAPTGQDIYHPTDIQHSVHGSSFRLISVHHNTPPSKEGSPGDKTALECITGGHELHYIFFKTHLITDCNQNKVQYLLFCTKFPVSVESGRRIFLHLEHFTHFPNCYRNMSFWLQTETTPRKNKGNMRKKQNIFSQTVIFQYS